MSAFKACPVADCVCNYAHEMGAPYCNKCGHYNEELAPPSDPRDALLSECEKALEATDTAMSRTIRDCSICANGSPREHEGHHAMQMLIDRVYALLAKLKERTK